jgi:hypothetical protein
MHQHVGPGRHTRDVVHQHRSGQALFDRSGGVLQRHGVGHRYHMIDRYRDAADRL